MGTRLINYLEENVFSENHELYLNLLSMQELNEYEVPFVIHLYEHFCVVRFNLCFCSQLNIDLYCNKIDRSDREKTSTSWSMKLYWRTERLGNFSSYNLRRPDAFYKCVCVCVCVCVCLTGSKTAFTPLTVRQ